MLMGFLQNFSLATEKIIGLTFRNRGGTWLVLANQWLAAKTVMFLPLTSISWEQVVTNQYIIKCSTLSYKITNDCKVVCCLDIYPTFLFTT